MCMRVYMREFSNRVIKLAHTEISFVPLAFHINIINIAHISSCSFFEMVTYGQKLL